MKINLTQQELILTMIELTKRIGKNKINQCLPALYLSFEFESYIHNFRKIVHKISLVGFDQN